MNPTRFLPSISPFFCAFSASLALLSAVAVAQPVEADEKSRLSQQRDLIEQRYKEAEAACQKRFVVTSCVKEAAKERSLALEPVRKQELQIREQERKQQTEDQLKKLERRKAEAANKQSAENGGRAKGGKPVDMTLTQRQEKEKRHADKLRSAEEHRAKVLQAQKERQKPPAASLPVTGQ